MLERSTFGMTGIMIAAVALTLACSSDGSGDGSDGTSGNTTTNMTGADDFAPFVLRCDPADADPCATFGSVPCCSDDPSALAFSDVTAFVSPRYEGRGGVGTPIFSGDNNALSRTGYCLAETTPASVALTEANGQGCRVPCNPNWPEGEIFDVCGQNAICCQAVELEPEDCVLDLAIGDAGCYRPVTGMDIVGLGGIDASDWSSSDHATHQDPGGANCEMFVAAVPPTVLTENGLTPQDALLACYRRLTVANQRGSCFATSELDSCPLEAPGYVDACAQLNLDNGLTGCG